MRKGWLSAPTDGKGELQISDYRDQVARRRDRSASRKGKSGASVRVFLRTRALRGIACGFGRWETLLAGAFGKCFVRQSPFGAALGFVFIALAFAGV